MIKTKIKIVWRLKPVRYLKFKDPIAPEDLPRFGCFGQVITPGKWARIKPVDSIDTGNKEEKGMWRKLLGWLGLVPASDYRELDAVRDALSNTLEQVREVNNRPVRRQDHGMKALKKSKHYHVTFYESHKAEAIVAGDRGVVVARERRRSGVGGILWDTAAFRLLIEMDAGGTVIADSGLVRREDRKKEQKGVVATA